MDRIISKLSRLFNCVPTVFWVFVLCMIIPNVSYADIVDKYNLAPFVPLVLTIMMNTATSLYKYFVGNGTGIIYIFIYVFLAYYIVLYLVKLHLPRGVLEFMGFSGGGEMWDGGTITGTTISENILKPCLRAILAALILLQIKPVYVTEWLVNPFLEFGSIYTEEILQNTTTASNISVGAPECPNDILQAGWLSKESCDFLIKPVYTISKENNKIIKYGLDFLYRGLHGMLNLIPHGGEDLMNVITGILLLIAFVSANVFMALLIIQGIFDFCLALIMYPFSVLAWVAKKTDSWFDVLPAFNQIIDSLKKLVITMIACAFILCVNIAIVHALFNWSSSVFVTASGGMATSNLPSASTSAMNFGQHSVLWISSLLTFFLMQNIFKMTRERLDMYTSGTPRTLYNNVTGDAKTMWGKAKATPETVKNIWQAGKKILKK